MPPKFQVDFTATEPKFRRPELLTHPHIPRPMAGVNPRTILGKEWWDETRRVVYATNNYNCWACGNNPTDKPLEAHEVYTIDYAERVMTFVEVVALCSDCHAFVHSGRLWMEYLHNKYSKLDLKRILCGRVAMLREAGLEPFWYTKAVYLIVCENWSSYDAYKEALDQTPRTPHVPGRTWRLVIGNDTYNSRGKLV